MKPFDELNRTPVLVLYWGLFGWRGNCGERKAVVRSQGVGLEQCMAARKCACAVRRLIQVGTPDAARGVVAEWTHTSSEPCLEGSAGAMVTAAVKVMSYPSGVWRHCGRAAAVRCEPSCQSRTRDKAAGSCRSGPHKNPGNPWEREAGPRWEPLVVAGRAVAYPRQLASKPK